MDTTRTSQEITVGRERTNSRRTFLTRALAVGGGVAAVELFGITKSARAAITDADILAFGNAAVGAERIAVAFYSNALGLPSEFGVR